jgi:hypothetical protein
MTRIVTLGDSITLGMGDPAPGGGWRGREPTSPAPSRRDDALWMATKGTRWFLRRSVDLIPYMLFMAAREALAAPREWPVAGLATTGLATTGLATTGPVRPGPVNPGLATTGLATAGPDVKGAPAAGDAQAAEPVAE